MAGFPTMYGLGKGSPLLCLISAISLSKIPFDAPEAETEIAGGLLAEYSGRNLAMFYLTDGVKTIVARQAGIVLKVVANPELQHAH